MWTLFFAGTLCDDISSLANTLLEEAPALAGLFVLFVVLASFMLLNMLIGIVCDVVTAVADVEKDEAAIKYVKDNLIKVLQEIDEDGDGVISQDEFRHFVSHPTAVRAFQGLGL